MAKKDYTIAAADARSTKDIDSEEGHLGWSHDSGQQKDVASVMDTGGVKVEGFLENERRSAHI